MKNITLSLEEEGLKADREYAQRHGISLNALIRQLLSQTVLPQSKQWLEECFMLMDRAQANSGGIRWNREDLYDV